ncbi:hypothetical protein [Methylobacterium sp. WL7]|uniref:hypothetical protein n=1 Tax=Methylobacterium sp. WL7 TaxID=2603900 RepID=UPI0011CBFBB7|nr:hypothetical protein [Methylobacterium sp. WL7]TXN42913.1 hypothetical protein FV233_20650 [Methylobacterium sp. WL7]
MNQMLMAVILVAGMTVTDTSISTAERPTNLVKLGFADMTKAQEDSLWRQVDQLAFFEATANLCGKKSDLEARIMAAVQECISNEALDRVRDRWRSKVKEIGRKIFVPKSKQSAFCNDADILAVHNRYFTDVARKSQEAERLCAACLASGVCR